MCQPPVLVSMLPPEPLLIVPATVRVPLLTLITGLTFKATLPVPMLKFWVPLKVKLPLHVSGLLVERVMGPALVSGRAAADVQGTGPNGAGVIDVQGAGHEGGSAAVAVAGSEGESCRAVLDQRGRADDSIAAVAGDGVSQ